MKLKSGENYDSLFEREGLGYLRIQSLELNKEVEISSSDMHFWQVYTPPDGKRIAVEPMTFCGNLYKIYDEKIFCKLAETAGFHITVKWSNE